MLASTIII